MKLNTELNTKLSTKKSETLKSHLAAIAFTAPFLFFYTLFMLYPVFKGAYTSLFNYRLGMKSRFVGLANYINAFQDIDFWKSLWHTIYFVLISTPVLVVAGLVLALIINANIPGRSFFRWAYFVPFTLSISVVTNLWMLMLQPHSGFLNVLTQKLGIGNIPWLNNPNLAWVSVLMATLWWTVGFNMVLFLAGLQEIPEQLYEAAKIDGANSWQCFKGITLPSLRGVAGMICLLQVIASFKLFGQTYLMLGGGPGNATRTLVQYIYETGFQNRQMGLASAYSVILLFVMLAVSFIQNRVSAAQKK